eukprot:scpid96839/ scgid3438/ WSC domain-containing protein 2
MARSGILIGALVLLVAAVTPGWSQGVTDCTSIGCGEAGMCVSTQCVCASGYTGDLCQFGTRIDNLIGCFPQDASSPLNRSITLGCTTPDVCSDTCRSMGFRYAGVSDGFRCWCGNSVPSGEIAANNCDAPCTFDTNQGCGGVGRSLVFQAGYEFFPLGVSPQSSVW